MVLVRAGLATACMAGGTGSARRGQAVTQLGRCRCAGWRVDTGDGLVLETCRLVVLVQVGLERKRLVTPLALEVLESRMGLHVCPEVGPVGKTLSTVSTPVRLVAAVRPHVSLQQPRS